MFLDVAARFFAVGSTVGSYLAPEAYEPSGTHWIGSPPYFIGVSGAHIAYAASGDPTQCGVRFWPATVGPFDLVRVTLVCTGDLDQARLFIGDAGDGDPLAIIPLHPTEAEHGGGGELVWTLDMVQAQILSGHFGSMQDLFIGAASEGQIELRARVGTEVAPSSLEVFRLEIELGIVDELAMPPGVVTPAADQAIEDTTPRVAEDPATATGVPLNVDVNFSG
jgi:hypothetical protein